jgi:speckle-type POZ protein
MPQAADTIAIKQLGTKAHLKNLFESGALADITIKSEDKELKVHKLILARSEVFAKMLSGETEEAQSAVIKIKDISHEVLVEMCRFLYYDEVPKMKSLALELMVAADKYMVEDLAAKCEKFLMDNITVENFHDVLVTANRLSKDKLREAAIDFIIA